MSFSGASGVPDGELTQHRGSRHELHPVDRAERLAGVTRRPAHIRKATSRSPFGPSQERWTAAVTAIKVWFVQTFEDARSRRMSCSRARKVMT